MAIKLSGSALRDLQQPVKKPISKAQIRSEMNQQISAFLDKGGEVSEIAQGISGRENAQGVLKADTPAFGEPKTERTYLPEVVAALDARKQKKEPPAKPKNRRPKKKIIYDDFGEPLRWEWEE